MPTLNLGKVIGPTGLTGQTGPATQLSVASTTTGAAGANASVTISGTAPNQSLAFTIPQATIPDGESGVGLENFRNTINLNGYRNPRIGLIGDSMIGTSRPATEPAIQGAFGVAGYGLVDYGVSAGASIDYANPRNWLNGETALVPLNGIVTFQQGGVNDIEGDTLKVYYLQEPGAGFFKIQTQANGGVWTDEVGQTAINANGAVAGVVITIQKSTYKTKWRIRCVGLGNNAGGAGSVRIIGAGIFYRFINGAIISYIYNNSSQVNNIDNAAQVSRAITDPILSDLGFNLVFLSHLDGAGLVNTWQSTLQNNVNLGVNIPDPSSTFTAAVGGLCTRNDHGWQTRQRVRVFSTGALPSGLELDTDYHLIRLDNNTFRLALTAENAIAGTGINLTTTGTGTLTISISRAPSWVIIGPPCGFDTSTDSQFEAQATAQESLAASRGDRFFDNRKWALPLSNALAKGLIIPGDVHYQPIAYRSWVPAMLTEIGIRSIFGLDQTEQNQIRFKRGGMLRDAAASGNTYNPSMECIGSFRIGNAANEVNQAFLALSRFDVVNTSESNNFTLSYRGNGLNILAADNSGFLLNNSAGVLSLASTQTGANQTFSSIGIPTNRFGRLYFTKSNASGTGNQTASNGVTHGSVRFAAGSSTPIVVTNNLADATCNIFCQVLGTDVTLTSVRVTRGAGSFTITPIAPATAETEVSWFILL